MLAKQPASLGGFEFDAIIKRSETMTSDVPEYATEEGYSITDNICRNLTLLPIHTWTVFPANAP